MNKNSLIALVLLVVVAAVAFFAGMKYQESKRSTLFSQGRQGGAFRQRFGQNFQAVRGQIVSVDDKGLTVKLQDDSSRLVIFSQNTTYVKSDRVAKDTLKIDDSVLVVGTQNSDGSLTAQDVQINPTR